jgi:hypothetical protein
MSVYIVKVIKLVEIAVKLDGPRDEELIAEAAEDESGLGWPEEIIVTETSISWEDAKLLSDGAVDLGSLKAEEQ